MARMFPDRILDDRAPASERKVFEALAKLDDDWVVCHSVAWQGLRHGRQNDGEADFVIAHPNRGALILEVKGGGISIVDGQWRTTNRHGESFSINPFDQVRQSKHVLGEYLAECITGVGNKVHLGHAVVFPDVEVADDLSAEGQREVILDRADLRDPSRHINRVSNYWDKLTTFDVQQMAALRKALAPSRQIKRVLRHEVEDRRKELIELTDQQLLTLGLLRQQRRALITGGAGTGKTVLATERARQLARHGMRVLLVCYNAPLGDVLAQDVGGVEGVTAGSFHKIARTIVSSAGMLPEGEWDSNTWDVELPAALPDAAEKQGAVFDAIVVDEGQDFHPAWWTSLQLLLADPDDGFLYIFADSQQDLYRVGWAPPFEAEPFPLDINCRNTMPIAERVNAIFGREVPSLGTDGPEPKFFEVAGAAQMPKQVAALLRRLLGEHDLAPGQITILSTQKALVDGLRGQEIDGVKLTDVTGRGITVETVHRFKGLESDAVVLLIPDLLNQADLSLAYVGMSRPMVVLYVIGPPTVKEALNWT